jgi:quercetin dioxygenase-like cupin family protein
MSDTTPSFTDVDVPALPADVLAILPRQGSMELQQDQPAKTHDWHQHSVDEELFVLAGGVTLFWLDDGERHSRRCPPGTWITLPAGTRHGSTAGEHGAIYLIRPQDGATAHTQWLAPAELPAAP